MLFTADSLQLYLFGRKNIKYQADSATKDRAKDTVKPKEIWIGDSTIPGRDLGVFSAGWIKSGTHMGPFIGDVINPDYIDARGHNDNMWEIFDESGEILHFIDGGSTDHRASWLSYVNCARNEKEQNLEVLQVGQNLFYRALKDIAPREELLVWYGVQSWLYLGLPLQVPATTHPKTKSTQETINQSQEQPDRNALNKLCCRLCTRCFNSRSNLKSHMRIHTKEKPFICKYCSRSFSQSSTLRNHVRLHTGEKPYTCNICRNSYSQLAGLRAHQRSSSHRSTQEVLPVQTPHT